MRPALRDIRLPAALLIVLLLCGCGGAGAPFHAALPAGAQTDLTLADSLAQLDALEAPTGVDSAVFAELKAALRSALSGAGTARFASRAPEGQRNVVTDLTLAALPDGGSGIQWTYRNVGDYNFDGQVNLGDLTQLALHWGKDIHSADWDRARNADGNGDGEINISDVTPLGANYLSLVAAWSIEGSASPDGPFTPLGQLPYSAGTGAALTAPRYSYAAGGGLSFFRVRAVDSEGNFGPASAVSSTLLLADTAAIIGPAGGPQFVSRGASSMSFTAPENHGIAAGDILVGSEDGGYLYRADAIVAEGDEITVYGSPAGLGDVIRQGTVTLDLTPAESSATAAALNANLDNLTLHSSASLQVKATSGHVSLAPRPTLTLNYVAGAGLTYGKAALAADRLELSASLQVSGSGHSGAFPATPAMSANYEALAATTTQDITLLAGGILPLAARVDYRIVVGVEGDGALDGTLNVPLNLAFDDLEVGALYTGDWQYLHGATAQHNGSQGPQFSANGTCRVRAYARVEADVTLLPGMYPGGQPDAQVVLTPAAELTATRMVSPAPGYDFALSGALSSTAGTRLDKLGLAGVHYSGGQVGASVPIRSGFVTDGAAITYNLGGVVMDNGSPVQGVTLSLRDADTDTEFAATTTAADGSYSFAGLPEGLGVRLVPSLPGYTFEPVSASLVMDGDRSQDFAATPQTFRLSGQVLEGGSGLPGVTITVRKASDATELGTAQTNSFGNYLVTGLPYGTQVTITPAKTNYTFAPNEAQAWVTSDLEQSFVAGVDRGTVQGKVTSGGAALLNVKVSLINVNTEQVLGQTFTNVNGDYAFPNLPVGLRLRIVPSLSGYSFDPNHTEIFSLAVGTQLVNFDAEAAAFILSGAVQHQGNPLAGVTVQVLELPELSLIGSAVTDTDGVYFVPDIPANTQVRVVPSRSGFGFGPDAVELSLTSNAQQNFVAFSTVFTLGGTIEYSGSPLSGVGVEVLLLPGLSSLGSAVTDMNGHYSVTGIPGNTSVRVIPSLSGFGFGPNSVDLSLAADSTQNFVAFVTEFDVSGAVEFNSMPLDGVLVQLLGPGEEILDSTVTDASGTFLFGGLPAGSGVSVEASRAGYILDPLFADLFMNSDKVVNFSAVEATHMLSGTILVEGTTSPLQGAFVHIYDLSDMLLDTTTTDNNGFYSFAALAHGLVVKIIPDAGSGWSFNPSAPIVTLDMDRVQDFSAVP
jgi:hypothetical protein